MTACARTMRHVNTATVVAALATVFCWMPSTAGGTLTEIRTRGELRHLGCSSDSSMTPPMLDLVKAFARYLDVNYTFIETPAADIAAGLLADSRRKTEDDAVRAGDLAVVPTQPKDDPQQTTELTSIPVSSTQVWLVVRSDLDIQPIAPSGKSSRDIAAVRALLAGVKLLGKKNTAADPSRYDLGACGARILFFQGNMNDIVPAIIKGEADGALFETNAGGAILLNWAGKVKVIGPVTPVVGLSATFARDSVSLVHEFERFLSEHRQGKAPSCR